MKQKVKVENYSASSLEAELGISLDRPPKKKYNSEEYLEKQVKDIDASLIQACESGKVEALKIYYQLTKRLVDKRENKLIVEISADEFYRRNTEAERRIREGKGQLIEEAQTLAIEMELEPEDMPL